MKPSELSGLFVLGAEAYFEQRRKLKGLVRHGVLSADSELSGGRAPKKSGLSPQAPRGGGSALAAIGNRVGKYGATKLKSGTVREFKSKGFNVGAPVKTPNDTGKTNTRRVADES